MPLDAEEIKFALRRKHRTLKAAAVELSNDEYSFDRITLVRAIEGSTGQVRGKINHLVRRRIANDLGLPYQSLWPTAEPVATEPLPTQPQP